MSAAVLSGSLLSGSLPAGSVPSAHVVAAGLDPNSVSPGLLGFIVVVIIGIATWLLARSMTKQLRKLDAGRAEQQESDEQPKPDAGQAHPADPKRGPEPNGAH